MREPKKRIPAVVLEQARKALGKVPAAKASQVAREVEPPRPTRGAKARDKIVGALRKLHPMD